MTELYRKYLLSALAAALVLLAVFFLLRGHDLPGGGFVGGLMAAAAIELRIISLSAREVEHRIGRLLLPMAGGGLLVAIVSMALGFFFEGAIFAAFWFRIPVVAIDVGTPTTFDFGVFLVVMSVTARFFLDLTLTFASQTPGPDAGTSAEADRAIEPAAQ